MTSPRQERAEGHLSKVREFYNQSSYVEMARNAASEMYNSRIELIRQFMNPGSVEVEFGCGAGVMQSVSESYIGLDISETALHNLGGKGVCCDSGRVPLRNNLADIILSYHHLEHVQDIESVLNEMDRLLKPGGVILLNDGWYCRRFVNSGILRMSWRSLPWRRRLLKAYAVFVDSKQVVMLRIMMGRIRRELRLFLGPGKPMALDCNRLSANYEVFLEPDSDATYSIDPHSLMLWLRSRGYRLEANASLLSRMLVRQHGVAARKM